MASSGVDHFQKWKAPYIPFGPLIQNLIGKVAKKKPTPIILSSKPNISSFSVISDRFSLCSPWKTHIFPKHPYFSKLIHKLIWISLQKIMIAPRKVYWRCCHPKFKFIILVPWLLPWIPQWLFPSNGFCHMIEPCIVPWVLPWNPLWVLLSNGFCHMNKPSLVAGKGWHFVRTFFVVGILSVPFFGLDFDRTISTCFGILSVGILSYHRWEKWNFLCSKQHGFQSFENKLWWWFTEYYSNVKVNVFFFYADTAFPNQSVYQKHCKGMAVKMRRTNRETSKWLKMISLKNLTMWANFEEAKTFFGSFPADHKTFGPWKQPFRCQRVFFSSFFLGCHPPRVLLFHLHLPHLKQPWSLLK